MYKSIKKWVGEIPAWDEDGNLVQPGDRFLKPFLFDFIDVNFDRGRNTAENAYDAE